MKKFLLLGIIAAMTGITFSVAGSGLVSMKEINRNTPKYKGQDILVSGDVIAVVDRAKFGLYVTNLNKPQPETKKGEAEINLYLLNDGSDGVYLVTLKNFEERQHVTVKTQIITTSKDDLGNESVMLFDQYISKKNGLSSLGYSRFTLQGLLKKLPKNKFWVLLVDVE